MITKTALLLVDIQYDFLDVPEATLGVQEIQITLLHRLGNDILPVVYDLLQKDRWEWDAVTASQDWHPKDHISFASNNDGATPFTARQVKDKHKNEISQQMWPDHCVQGSRGAELEDGIAKRLAPWQDIGKCFIVKKGIDSLVDAYSAFASEDSPLPDPLKGEPSPLGDYLRQQGIERVVCVGLATDYCVRASAIAALDWGFETILVPEAMRAVGGKDAEKKVFQEIEERGGQVTPLAALAGHLA